MGLVEPAAELAVGVEDVADPQAAHTELLRGEQHVLDGGADGLNIHHVGEHVAEVLRAEGVVFIFVENEDRDRRLLHDLCRPLAAAQGNALGFAGGDAGAHDGEHLCALILAHDDEAPRLFVLARRGQNCGGQNLPEYVFRQRIGLEAADTPALTNRVQCVHDHSLSVVLRSFSWVVV